MPVIDEHPHNFFNNENKTSIFIRVRKSFSKVKMQQTVINRIAVHYIHTFQNHFQHANMYLLQKSGEDILAIFKPKHV